MLKRSELAKEENMFFTEQEAIAFKNAHQENVYTIQMIAVHLDDATDDELNQRKKNIENDILLAEQENLSKWGRTLINDAQKTLLRSFFDTQFMWQAEFVRLKKDEPTNEYNRLMVDDEIEGWVTA